MATPPKNPDPLAERISRLPDEPAKSVGYKPAVPPTYPGRLGFGKVLVPAPRPAPPASPPPPKSVPVHEETKVDGALQPAPGSAPMPPAGARGPGKRIDSPPPISNPRPREEAPDSDPKRLKAALRKGHELASRAPEKPPVEPAGPVLDSIRIELPANLRGGLSALARWLIGAVIAALLGGGGAVVGSQTSNPIPPAVAECPAQLEQLRAKVTRLEGRADRLEDNEDEARKRWRKTDEKVEDTIGRVNELDKRTPKINP